MGLRNFFQRFKNIKTLDLVENQFVKQSLMLQAHLTCVKQINNLPQQIEKTDKTVKFDKKYSGLFKKNENYEKVFGLTTWYIVLKMANR